MVFGTPLFADNQQFTQSRLNGDLFLNAVGWLVGPGGAGLDPQPHRARVARRPHARRGGPALLPLRAHHPAAADRARHRRLVAAENRGEARVGSCCSLPSWSAALGGVLYVVYEFPQAEREATKEKLARRRRATPSPASTLVYPDREIELAKGDKGWRLDDPVDAPADEAAVKSLLGTITGAEVQRTLDELPADLAAFGLDKPHAVIRLHREGRDLPLHRRRQEHGRSAARPTSARATSRRSTSTAIVHPDGAQQAAEGPARQAAPDVPGRRRDARRDHARPRVAPVTLVRKDEGRWTLEPGGQPADMTEVRSYLSSLRAARAIDFPDDARGPGAVRPRQAPADRDGGPARTAPPQTLLSAANHGGHARSRSTSSAADQPNIVTLGDWSFRRLDKDAGQFRDKTVLGFERRPGRPRRHRAQGRAGATLVARPARRLDGRRARSSPGAAPSSASSTICASSRARRSPRSRQPTLKQFGLAAPDLRITVTDASRSPSARCSLTEAGRQVLRHARRRHHGLRDARLHVHPARQAAPRLRSVRSPRPRPGPRPTTMRRRTTTLLRLATTSRSTRSETSAAAARQLWRPSQRCGDSRLRRCPISVRSWATSSRMSSSARRPTSRPPGPTTGRRRNRPERM